MKTIFGIIGGIVAAFSGVARYCALIASRRSEGQANMENNEVADQMFWRKQICPRCKTGKDSYELDNRSEACPYIGCWKINKCPFYKPFDNPSKRPFIPNK